MEEGTAVGWLTHAPSLQSRLRDAHPLTPAPSGRSRLWAQVVTVKGTNPGIPQCAVGPRPPQILASRLTWAVAPAGATGDGAAARSCHRRAPTPRMRGPRAWGA